MKEKPIEFTRASTKGQIVIPQDIRKNMKIKEGSVFVIMHPKSDTLVLKKIDKKFGRVDFDMLHKVEATWKDIEEGRYKRASVGGFFKELAKWKR
jgi:AbrB family looped-hinge helix DNA binding protein